MRPEAYNFTLRELGNLSKYFGRSFQDIGNICQYLGKIYCQQFNLPMLAVNVTHYITENYNVEEEHTKGNIAYEKVNV